ncbi:hypothetical protein ACFPWS_12970 [Streptomyces aureus]|uniref:hypothetical protein n=1 Tax=Streptomyces aureus TaxID=193461 RepID=UPI0031D4C406
MTTSSSVPLADDADSDRLRALLERAAEGADSQAWSDLWTELYHNGSLDVAHPLVLHTLTDMAEDDHADTAASALHLAGALLVQADQRYETQNLRNQHVSQVARLLAAANRWRQDTADRNDYCHLLEAVLNLEGDIHWAQDLIWGVVSEEYEIECPNPGGCEYCGWSSGSGASSARWGTTPSPTTSKPPLSTRPTPERWRVSATACTPLPGPTVTMKSRMP